jgi:glycosyltransferase involved in cell wall biosynthesis
VSNPGPVSDNRPVDQSGILTDRDRELIRFYNEPAPVGARFGVTRYMYELHRQHQHLQEVFPDLDCDGAGYVEWIRSHGPATLGIIDELMPSGSDGIAAEPLERGDRAALRRPLGVNVVGHLQAELGLGEMGRLVIAGLDARGVPVLPVQGSRRSTARHGHDFRTVLPHEAGFPITITCVNPDTMGAISHELGRSFFTERHSIGYWWWEVDGPTPFTWRPHFELVDEVWVGSRYVADAFGAELQRPVHRMILPVSVPEPPALGRAELGLPDGFLFLFMFDYASVVARKNPIGAVQAFRRSFDPGDGAALVIKCVNSWQDARGHEQLLRATAGREDIHIVDRFSDSAEKNAILASCDCYVSLHRAEGFGLPLAEAMFLGKPVIATGYSGNLEFMSEHNSYLVAHAELRVGEGSLPYPFNGIWAEPEVDHAARLMREVFEHRDAAAGVGERAAADIRTTHSPEAAGRVMEERLLEIAAERESLEPAPRRRAAVDRARELLRHGPENGRPAEHGTRASARQVMLRAIRPFATYQRRVDEQLLASIEELHGLGDELAEQSRHGRDTVEQQALVRAAELAASRRTSEPPGV